MYLVFDIGGTNTRIAISHDGKTLGEIKTHPTPKNFSEAINLFKETALQLTNGGKIDVACGGVRSLDMGTKDRLLNHPTIPLWVNEPLKEELEKALETKVYLENDAALAGLGEANFGAGKGRKIVAYITVSTGIGGVRIVDGKIDENTMGFEPGNQIIDADVSLEPKVEYPGYLERYISGTAIEKRYGSKSGNITDRKIWDEMAILLAIGINNTIVHWSPEIVILGGALMNKISIESINSHLKNILKIFPLIPEIVPSSLGQLAPLQGALALINQSGL